MLYKELLLGGDDNSELAIYRPTGWPWNTNIDNNSTTTWTNWINTEISNGFTNCVKVDGVLNDAVHRATHSSHTYSSVVFVINPYNDFSISLTYERTYHSAWHNSATRNQAYVEEVTVNNYCKALIFRPASGAGGGFWSVYKITANCGGRGVLNYEFATGIDNDSNKPVVGSGANSNTINGKQYVFYQG